MARDDSVVGVGFSWGAGDEKKMRDSFGLGCRDLFTHFVDVRTQAEVLGYHGFSVGSLAKQVLGFQPPVSKQVCAPPSCAAQAGRVPLQADELAAGDHLQLGGILSEHSSAAVRRFGCAGHG